MQRAEQQTSSIDFSAYVPDIQHDECEPASRIFSDSKMKPEMCYFARTCRAV